MISHENDISAEKEIQSESSWFQSKNEHKRWSQGSCSKKIKGKKTVISIKKRNRKRPHVCGLFVTGKIV